MKILLFIPLFLFASVIDFSPCYEKFSFVKNSIPVTKTRSVTFSRPKNYISYDPFTGVYVVYAKNKRVIKFSKFPKLGWWMASIKKNSVFGGTYAREMVFFKSAKLSVASIQNSVISDLFCRAYGVGRGDGFIGGDYINHFVKYGYYGDIGIYVNDEMRVMYYDPYYVKGIKAGDKILKINSKKATPQSFKKYVLFGKKGERVTVKTTSRTLRLKIRKRKYHFSPLLAFGIVVDKNLNILYLPKWLEDKTFIKPPAKLVALNGREVKSIADIRKIDTKNVTITIEKDGIRINVRLDDGVYAGN
ncbi:MAG: hypothetical protein GXO62_04050 [Epsilonproteobacteria bacterium]|nr:hypothetical protein [Campylobacterota bacterium]